MPVTINHKEKDDGIGILYHYDSHGNPIRETNGKNY